MKKKLTLIATAVALGALVVVGATMAYFTSSDTATNVITTGNIAVKVTEHKENGDEFVGNDNEFKNLVPGAIFYKNPTVKNTGNNDAIVRAQVNFYKKGEEKPMDAAELKAYFPNGIPSLQTKADSNWVKDGDNTFYYNKVLEAGQTTDEIFTTVTISTDWNNDDVNKEFDIKIEVLAVQSENLVEGENIDAIKAGFSKYEASIETTPSTEQ